MIYNNSRSKSQDLLYDKLFVQQIIEFTHKLNDTGTNEQRRNIYSTLTNSSSISGGKKGGKKRQDLPSIHMCLS